MTALVNYLALSILFQKPLQWRVFSSPGCCIPTQIQVTSKRHPRGEKKIPSNLLNLITWLNLLLLSRVALASVLCQNCLPWVGEVEQAPKRFLKDMEWDASSRCTVRSGSRNLLDSFVFVSSVVHHLARSVHTLSRTCMNRCGVQTGQCVRTDPVMQYTSLTQILTQGPLGVIKEDNQLFRKV